MRRFGDRPGENQRDEEVEVDYPHHVNEDYYNELCAILPKNVGELNLDEYDTKYAEIVERTPIDERLTELLEKNPCELKRYTPLVVKPCEATLDTIRVRPQILFDAGAVKKSEFPARAFGNQLWEGHINWYYSYRLHEPEPDSTSHRFQFGPPQRGTLVLEYLRDDSGSLANLWWHLEQEMQHDEIWTVEEGNLAREAIPHSRMSNLVSVFFKILVMHCVPMAVISEWYDSLKYNRSMNKIHLKGDVDCHFIQFPELAVLLFLYRSKQRDNELVATGQRPMQGAWLRKEQIQLATGGPNNGRPKNSRRIMEVLLKATGLGDSITEELNYRGDRGRGRLGMFYAACRYLTPEAWGALLSLCMNLISAIHARPCCNLIEVVFYNSQAIAHYFTIYNRRTVYRVGSLLLQNFMVDYPLYNTLCKDADRAPKHAWKRVFSRSACVNKIRSYTDGFPKQHEGRSINNTCSKLKFY
ncbi:unnamed protein product [Oikopleura dioica]|uniref:Uncharacterized protein n=1 Tax=Oikopleura dioica TaxID=34765 RepID=E4YLE2_OIKDI|nr:unnamed protein product [Oikopleura dioica]